MVKFYYGVASGSSRKALRQLEEPNIMINYATQNNKPWDGIDNLFIDSGGYSFLQSKGEYKTSDKEYLEFIEEHNPDYFALRDYPCEPSAVKSTGLSVNKHIKKTTERHKNILSIIESYSFDSEPVSVIQGYKLNHYIKHLETMRSKNLLTDYVAIGSVCRRNQDEEIRKIINEIDNRLRDRKIHAFGIKSNILRFKDIRNKICSADSMAYEYGEQYGERVSGTNRKSFRDSALEYLKFKKKINNLINSSKDKNQKTLDEIN